MRGNLHYDVILLKCWWSWSRSRYSVFN